MIPLSPWYVDGMRLKEGRAFVLAVDFIVTEKNIRDSGYLKSRKTLIMKVVDYILLLMYTHGKVFIDFNCFISIKFES